MTILHARTNSHRSVYFGPFEDRGSAMTWAEPRRDDPRFEGPWSTWDAVDLHDRHTQLHEDEQTFLDEVEEAVELD